MLSDLAAVDWARWQPVYGPAAGAPDQHRALASPDADARQRAIHALCGDVWNLGRMCRGDDAVGRWRLSSYQGKGARRIAHGP